MGSRSEPIPVEISPLKQDPAWRHVQMFKNDGKVQLKCKYCLKLFKGGGIHRIKEHLANRKGNAPCCPRVPQDVKNQMLQSLEVIAVKSGKKQKDANGVKNLEQSELGSLHVVSQSNLNTGLQLHSPQNLVEQSPLGNLHVASRLNLNTGLQLHSPQNLVEQSPPGFITPQDEGMRSRASDKKKKGRVENSSSTLAPLPLDTCPPITNDLNRVSTVDKDQVHMAIGRFLYDIGAPLDAVNSSYFQPMIDVIASKGLGLQATSYHDLRGWILKNSGEEMSGFLDRHKAAWGKTGCSILVDEWITETGRILINILVYCAEATVFLKTYDVSNIVTSVDALYELLKEVVEEVGVRNVVQVISDSTDHYIAAGKRLTETYPTMYWTPCAARAVNLILEDIGKLEWVNMILEHVKRVTRFIYNHGVILNMMRRYTGGMDLVQPSHTRSATDFTSLKTMVSLKDTLQGMVTSQEWVDSVLSKTPGGIAVIDIILSQSFWSSCSTLVLLTDPLVGILSMVHSHERPSVGYILAGIYRAKEAIKRVLVEKKEYMLYWKIIDNRWDQLLQHPLHEASFFLNPKYYYSLKGDVHDKIPSGMLDCIERLMPDIKVQDKINKEMIGYKNVAGDFGRNMAVRARHTLLPAEWWSTYAGDCPNLARLAIRILSQNCSATGCKRDPIPFEQIHKTRNRLEHQRLSDLVFVQYNLRLQQIKLQKNSEPGAMDPISLESCNFAQEWVAEKEEFFEEGDSNWVALKHPVGNTMPLEWVTQNVDQDIQDDLFEDLFADFRYQDKGYGMGIDDDDDDDK
ncbi:uncharacterized protein LOC113313876 [Papaver somniferum]|uniref:uncharacterized protein LOC113313876 n=1 Tax=Papaver somniferum TaxID=3469 RepID=UPI000E6FBA86|nr:uncharacterized protein LOC113313876 [Papaver somniferum]